MTDFVDDDLVRRGENTEAVRLGAGGHAAMDKSLIEPDGSSDLPLKGAGDFNLTRMAWHKQQVEDDVAKAMKELEVLRQRQESLESQKRRLEGLRKKQTDYERGRGEMIELLSKSLISLEKEELNAEQAMELLSVTRKKFKVRLAELEGLDPETWPDDQVREELTKALAVIEDARTDYNKSMARVDALTSGDQKETGHTAPVIFDERWSAHEEEKPFSHWLYVGFAVSLPLIVVLTVLSILYYLHMIGMW